MSSGPLRVAVIDHCARLSGGELALARVLGAMEGVERHVVLAEDGPLVSQLRNCGVTVEVLPMAERTRNLHRDLVGGRMLAGPHALDAVVYAIRLAAHIHRIRPDIVHTNSLKSALYGGVAAKIARVRLVVQLNDRIAEDYLSAPAVRVVRSALRWMPDAIVANSQTTLSTLGRSPPSRARASAVVVYPPVAAVPACDSHRGATLRIGMVGRVAPWKGQHVFLQALARAFGSRKATGDESWEAVVVGAPLFGEEEERYAADLPRLVSKLGLDGRVRFLGFSDDVPGELARMHVLVHSSVTPEPFGLVVIEAMAAGLPVIAATPGGPAEVIDDGVTGLLYPAGDIDALAEALQRVAADPALRARLAAAAKLKSAEFAPAIAAAKMRAVYDSVASARGRRWDRLKARVNKMPGE